MRVKAIKLPRLRVALILDDNKRQEEKWSEVVAYLSKYFKSWGDNKPNIHLLSEIAEIAPITILSFTEHSFSLTNFHRTRKVRLEDIFYPPRPDTFDESVLFDVIVVVVVLASQVT